MCQTLRDIKEKVRIERIWDSRPYGYIIEFDKDVTNAEKFQVLKNYRILESVSSKTIFIVNDLE